MLSDHVLHKIVAIPPPYVTFGRDLPGWRWEQDYRRVWQEVILSEKLQVWYNLPFMEWFASNIRVAFSTRSSGMSARKSRVFRWQCPLEGWIKANSDGAMNPSSGKIGAGGCFKR
ncbi:hypothetical protein V6N11_081945 [Hibiscus sabdariffa]|uniref:Reverse transcriptase zinc-binding domain-containing protein n=1 Tax=Hibiscus sabdariffa TaxID=183260 RepID=A0ABR2Q7M0_9ROSI